MRSYTHTFYIDSFEATPEQQQGWYYAFGCDPACLPESDPVGPFGDERLMEKRIREEMEYLGYVEVGNLVFENNSIEGKPEMFPEEVNCFACGNYTCVDGSCLDDELLREPQDEGRPFDVNQLDCPFVD